MFLIDETQRIEKSVTMDSSCSTKIEWAKGLLSRTLRRFCIELLLQSQSFLFRRMSGAGGHASGVQMTFRGVMMSYDLCSCCCL